MIGDRVQKDGAVLRHLAHQILVLLVDDHLLKKWGILSNLERERETERERERERDR